MRIKMMALMIVVSLLAMSIPLPTSQAMLFPSGKVITAHQNSPTGYTFAVSQGDNITIHLFNYTGDQADYVWVLIINPLVPYPQTFFEPVHYLFEYDYLHVSVSAPEVSCFFGINITSINDSCWFIVATDTPIDLSVHIDMFTGAGQLQWTVTRTPSKYSPDYATHDDINDLQVQIGELGGTLAQFYSVINTIQQNQTDMQQNITDLWDSFNKLNTSLNDLSKSVNALKTSDIAQINQNITKIKTDLANIQANITSLYKLANTTALQKQMDKLSQEITKTNANVTALTNSIPSAYNDTALKARITKLETDNAALKTENSQLKTQLDTLDKDKQDKIKEDPAAKAVPYGGLALGIVALIVAIVALVSRPQKPASSKGYIDDGAEE